MKKFKLSVEWKMCEQVEVELPDGSTLQDAINHVYDEDEIYSIGNLGGEYVDDSFFIDVHNSYDVT